MLSEQKANEVRWLLAGYSNRVIAAMTGVNRNSVQRIRSGKWQAVYKRRGNQSPPRFSWMFERKIPWRRHGDNLVVSLRFRDTGILWQEVMEKCGITEDECDAKILSSDRRIGGYHRSRLCV